MKIANFLIIFLMLCVGWVGAKRKAPRNPLSATSTEDVDPAHPRLEGTHRWFKGYDCTNPGVVTDVSVYAEHCSAGRVKLDPALTRNTTIQLLQYNDFSKATGFRCTVTTSTQVIRPWNLVRHSFRHFLCSRASTVECTITLLPFRC